MTATATLAAIDTNHQKQQQHQQQQQQQQQQLQAASIVTTTTSNNIMIRGEPYPMNESAKIDIPIHSTTTTGGIGALNNRLVEEELKLQSPLPSLTRLRDKASPRSPLEECSACEKLEASSLKVAPLSPKELMAKLTSPVASQNKKMPLETVVLATTSTPIESTTFTPIESTTSSSSSASSSPTKERSLLSSKEASPVAAASPQTAATITTISVALTPSLYPAAATESSLSSPVIQTTPIPMTKSSPRLQPRHHKPQQHQKPRSRSTTTPPTPTSSPPGSPAAPTTGSSPQSPRHHQYAAAGSASPPPPQPQNTRRVHFHSTVHYKEMQHINDYSPEQIEAMWITMRDYQIIKQMVKSTVRMMMNGDEVFNEQDPVDYCTRGLEFKTRNGTKIRATHKLKCKSAVLNEQDMQREEGYCDAAMIAMTSMEASLECREAARARGWYDAQMVELYRHQEELILQQQQQQVRQQQQQQQQQAPIAVVVNDPAQPAATTGIVNIGNVSSEPTVMPIPGAIQVGNNNRPTRMTLSPRTITRSTTGMTLSSITEAITPPRTPPNPTSAKALESMAAGGTTPPSSSDSGIGTIEVVPSSPPGTTTARTTCTPLPSTTVTTSPQPTEGTATNVDNSLY